MIEKKLSFRSTKESLMHLASILLIPAFFQSSFQMHLKPRTDGRVQSDKNSDFFEVFGSHFKLHRSRSIEFLLESFFCFFPFIHSCLFNFNFLDNFVFLNRRFAYGQGFTKSCHCNVVISMTLLERSLIFRQTLFPCSLFQINVKTTPPFRCWLFAVHNSSLLSPSKLNKSCV